MRKHIVQWNKWRKANPDAPVDLRRADLTGADLTHADLTHADLHGAVLIGALHNANPQPCTLHG